MSTVYRATDARLRRTVAVKVLLAGLADEDAAYIARFEREARAAAALQSPSVVGVYDVGLDGDTRFIVMEYVSGRSLASLLSGGEPLAVDETVRIAQEVANALGEAHARGIVHRDIKPANVMIADDGSVKVLDFGVARMLDGTTITQEASVLGTAAYMAPERALGQPGDARSDIYSLGCLVYAMLTGVPPFRAELAAALLHQHINAHPPRVRQRRAEVPVPLDALVTEMLAKSPEDRPSTAYEVRDRLATVTDPTVPTVRMSPTPASFPQPRRRRVLGAAAVAAAIAVIALLIATGGGSSRRAASATTGTSQTTARSTAPPRPATSSAIPAQSTAKPPATHPAAPAPSPARSRGHHGAKGPPPGHGDKHGAKHSKGGGH
jgi:serine/threonine-protein kinase